MIINDCFTLNTERARKIQPIFPNRPSPSLTIYIDQLRDTPANEWAGIVRTEIIRWVRGKNLMDGSLFGTRGDMPFLRYRGLRHGPSI
jgi:hypothetical protein